MKAFNRYLILTMQAIVYELQLFTRDAEYHRDLAGIEWDSLEESEIKTLLFDKDGLTHGKFKTELDALKFHIKLLELEDE